MICKYNIGNSTFDTEDEVINFVKSQHPSKFLNFLKSRLNDTQQTVARKYEEIAEILKKEKPVEVVTDENGFDWYEAPITQEDTQTPVVAFSLSQSDPQLKYQTEEGNIYTSYAEALRNTNGSEIKIGANTVNGFQEIYSKSTNTNVDTQDGLINHLIKTGTLSDKSYKENGKTHLLPEGKTFAKKRINAEIIKDAFQKQLGIKSAKLKADSSIELNEDMQRNKVTVTAKNGEQVVVSMDELNAPFSELKKKFDVYTIATALASDAVQNEMSKKTEVKPIEIVPENELQEKVLNLLKKFGIKTLSIADYLAGYTKRNELPITAKALADIANKVVAFKDGIVESDDLLEETAHLIEASIPQEKKENILRNIHKTKEWGQYAKQYEGVYATEAELRREILGKVIANALKENFAQRGSNQTENAIIAKIKEFFDEFIQTIRNFFQESYQTELDALNNDIFNSLFSETLELDLEGKGVFFSTTSASLDSKRLVQKAKDALEIVKDQERLLSKKYQNPANKAFIKSSERLLDDLDTMEQISGVAQFTRLISSQTNQLTESASKKSENEYPFSAEENVVYRNLQERIRPMLSSINQMLDDKDKLQGDIKAELGKIAKNLSTLEAVVDERIEPTILRMAEDIAEKYDMTEKDRLEYMDIMRASLSGSLKDTDILHTNIGSLLLARNGILNMAGLIQKRMGIQTTSDFQKSFKEMANKLVSLKWSNKDWDRIIDKDTFTIINPISEAKVKELNKKERTDIVETLLENPLYLDLKSLNITEETNFEDLIKENPSLKEEITLFADAFSTEWRKITSARREKFFSKEYLDRMENHTVLINGENPYILIPALDRDASYRREATQIRINAGDNLTKSDRVKLKEISQKRAEDASPRSLVTGELIKGVKEVYDENLEKYVVVIDTNVNLTPQEQDKADIIVGLNHISYRKQDFFKKEQGDRNGIPQNFIDKLNEIPQDEQLEWLENNAYISFPDSFYEQFKMNSGIVTRLREAGEDGLVEDIRRQQAIINRVLRVNAVDGRPAETNYLEITDTQKKSVTLAQSTLETLYANAKLVLTEEVVDNELDAETIPNQAYFDYLEESGDNELEFIIQNTTPAGRSSIESAKKVAEGTSPNKSFKKWFNDSMSEQEKQEALINYARTKLLPYLKRTEPIGYTEEFRKVVSGETSVSDWITRTDLVKVNPSFTFYESTNDNLNLKWQENKKQGKEQWTEEYLKKVKDDRYDAIEKDTRLKEGYDTILKYYDYQIENNNLSGVQSRYQIPGVRRTMTQRVSSLDANGIKEMFKDMTTFRAEEQETGSKILDTLYTIPTYYDKPLPEKGEQTTDYLYAFAVYGQAATLHKYRRENIGDMFLLEDAITKVKDQSKNAYKMFNSFLNYNFYGKQEQFSYKILGGKVDLGKVLKTLNSLAKTSNLASVIIPITSAATATVQKNIERFVGEIIDPVSSNKGNNLFMKYAGSSARESMAFESKSVPNVIAESLGLYSIVHRFENSQLSKAGRALVNLNSKVHELGNFPVVQRMMFGIIASYRYVDGKIMQYNKFKQKLEAEGFKGNIQNEWKKQPEFVEDFISAVRDGVLDFAHPEFLETMQKKVDSGVLIIPQGKTLLGYLEEKKLDIATKTLSAINRIDAQIPNDEKSIWARDSRASFFLSHLNFLLSAIPRRFKHRHFNLAEDGVAQEGTWRTAVNFVGDIIKSPKNIKEVYAQLDEGQRKNLKRVMVELGYTNALALLALLLSGFNDEDDDPIYALTIADLLLSRTAIETVSGTVGLPSTIMNLNEEPIMLARKIKDWARVTDLANEEKRTRYLNGVIPFFKDISKFSDPLKTRQTYMHFQEGEKDLFDNYTFLSNLVDED